MKIEFCWRPINLCVTLPVYNHDAIRENLSMKIFYEKYNYELLNSKISFSLNCKVPLENKVYPNKHCSLKTPLEEY